MKAAGIALVIIIALALQTSLARFLTPGGGLVDFVYERTVRPGADQRNLAVQFDRICVRGTVF